VFSITEEIRKLKYPFFCAKRSGNAVVVRPDSSRSSATWWMILPADHALP